MKVRVSGVVLKHNLILLIRHDYDQEQLWHIPGGGVKEKETLTEALNREFLEELDVGIKAGALWLVCDGIRPDGGHVLHCVFIVDHLEGTPTIQPAETSGIECKWVPITDVLSLHLYPNVGSYVNKLAINYPDLSVIQYIGRI